MTLNGRTLFILALLAGGLYLAAGAFRQGDTTRAMVYLGIGVALTIYRLRRAGA